MNSLVQMGAEKYQSALLEIKKAIKISPNNEEYQHLKSMIEKQIKP